MNTTKLFLATIVVFAISFGLSGLWHMVIFKDFYYATDVPGYFGRREPLLALIAAGYLVESFAISWFFLKAYPAGTSIINGLGFGLVAGLMELSFWSLINYGTLEFPRVMWTVMSGSFSLIHGLITGLALALVVRKK